MEKETVKCNFCGEIYERPAEDEDTEDLEPCPNCGGYDPLYTGICPSCGKEGWGYGQLCEECHKEFGHIFMFSTLTEEEKAAGMVTVSLDRCDVCGGRVDIWQTKQSIWKEVIPPTEGDREDWLLGGILCLSCFEKKLGRKLRREELILEEDFM